MPQCSSSSHAVDKDFMWSEWSDASVYCGVGHRDRTTLCGARRKRLPSKPLDAPSSKNGSQKQRSSLS